jgi:hypothetical protein
MSPPSKPNISSWLNVKIEVDAEDTDPHRPATPSQPRNPSPAPKPHSLPQIPATSTPQWEWTIIECRAWLSSVLAHYLDYSPEAIDAVIRRFKGHGPTIFSRTSAHWKELLVDDEMGALGIYDMILARRRGRGAVPAHVILKHGNAGK